MTATTAFDRTGMDRICGFVNGKGGVLKTTLTANVGALLAVSGWKVLLVDMDPQGNLGLDLGYRHGDPGRRRQRPCSKPDVRDAAGATQRHPP